MKNDNKMKPDNKSGFPGLIFLLIIGLIVVLAFQNLSDSKMANVAFSHQVEHLVNLDLIDPNSAKKISLNDNLVTFSGTFAENYSEAGKERYRYLSLLAQNHDLQNQKEKLLQNLEELQQQVYESTLYFLQVSGIKLPPSGFVVVSNKYNVADKSVGITIKERPIVEAPYTLPNVKEQLAALKAGGATEENVDKLGRDLYALVQEYRSQKIGIGNESIKRNLKETELGVEKALNDSEKTPSEKLIAYSRAVSNLDAINLELISDRDGVKLYELRVVRNYLDTINEYNVAAANLSKNIALLDKARGKVQNVVWFFNNQEVSTKSLEAINSDEYARWFASADKEWQAFPQNKGLSFKAPDQPRTLVLEKTFKSEEPAPNYFSYLFTFLPILLVAMLLYFIFSRQMKGVGSSAMNFGKSPAKMLVKGNKKVTFSDVAGIDEAKEELEEIVDFLRDPHRFTKLGAKIPKGVLLVGSPGTGKTLIAKAVSGEAGVPFFSISGSDFVEMFVGVGASRVRDLFDQARKNAPCIIFIDEIDAVGRHRGSGLGGGHDEREQTLNQLLVEVDGMDSTEGIIIIAATNRPDVLDKALLRPGRFDRSVYVDLPDFKGRLAIIKVHIKNVKVADDVDLKELANRTAGLAGADIANIINEAALFAARKRRNAVTQEDLRYAQEKVQFGKERKSMQMEQEDMVTTAWHEAGHALISLILKTSDSVSKVTRIPRGRSLGATHFEPKKQRVNYSKRELLDQLVVLMGGRVAEEIVNNDVSSGAQMDIKQATHIARSMVCEWGMSDKVGMVSYSEDGQQNLMAGFHEREYSNETAIVIDQEIKELLHNAHQKAREMLKTNYDKLKLIAEMLIEFETLERADLDKIMEGTFKVEEKREQLKTFHGVTHKEPPPIPAKLKKRKSKTNGGKMINPEPA